VAAEHGVTWPGVPAFFEGHFRTGDLTGLTEAAMSSNPAWHLDHGTVAAGVLKI
jgi:hypothetical protein